MNPRTSPSRSSPPRTVPRPSGSGPLADPSRSRCASGSGSASGHTPHRRRAFTLTEALVSIAILVVIMTAVGRLFRISGDSMSKATANNDILAQVRQLARQLDKDLANRQPDSFMAIAFEYEGPFAVSDVDTPRGTWRFARADRIVFYTAGHVTASNREHFIPIESNSVQLSQMGITPGSPITGGVARVMYGHDHDYVTVPLARRKFGRRQTVLAPGLYEVLLNDPQGSTFVNQLDPENPANYPGDNEDVPGVADGFDYTFWPLAHFENQDAQTVYSKFYMNDFHPGDSLSIVGNNIRTNLAGSGRAPQQSFVRRPVIDLEHRDDSSGENLADPVGLGALFLDGVAEFKIQIWVEDKSEEFLDRQDVNQTAANLNSEPMTLDENAIVSSRRNPDVLLNAHKFPRWWPEEDYDRDNIAAVNGYQPTEDPNIGDGDAFNDADFKGFPFNRIITLGGNQETIGRARFGVYFAGPYDPDISPDQNAVVGGPPLLRFRGLGKLPRALKISVRIFDRNNRYENGQTHSVVIPLDR